MARTSPSNWPQCELVLRFLIERERAASPRPAVEGLYGLAAWEMLWKAARRSPAEAPSNCPYRGLEAFQQEHASYFFGRKKSTDDLVNRLAAVQRTGGLLMLVGPSGVGKSSLLRAGLLPMLNKNEPSPAGSTDWRAVSVTPGPGPIGELVTRIPELDAVLSGPRQREPDPVGVRAAITAHTQRRQEPGTRLVIVVDQFEEVFTLCADERERRAFIEALHVASVAEPGDMAPALVVVGVRADFYGRCFNYPCLAEALQERQMLLPPMSADELEEAVVGPARSVGLRLEPGLVDVLLRDAGLARSASTRPDAGVLPLVSHALAATWEQRKKNTLTVEGYRLAGGIHGAVEATAEQAWAQLDEQGKLAGLGVLLRLTQIGGSGGQDTRGRRDKGQLLEQVGDRASAEAALEVLAGARLVTLDAHWVQLAHEAVLRAWPRLRTLIDEHREALLLRQRVEEDASVWAGQRRDASLLYRGARLETARGWAWTADLDGPSQLARAFLATSVRQHRRQLWAVRAGMVVVVVLALVAAATAVIARNQRNDAVFADVVAEAAPDADCRPVCWRPSWTWSLTGCVRMIPRSTAGSVHPEPGAWHAAGRQLRPHLRLGFQPGRPHLGHRKWAVPRAAVGRVRHGSPDAAGRSAPHRGPVGLVRWCSARTAVPSGWRAAAGSSRCGTSRTGRIRRSWYRPCGTTVTSCPWRSARTAARWRAAATRAPCSCGTSSMSLIRHPLARCGRRVRAWSRRWRSAGTAICSPPAITTAPCCCGTWSTRPTRSRSVGRSSTTRERFTRWCSARTAVAATGDDDKTARLWNLADPTRPALAGEPLPTGQSFVWSVAFSPDGRILLTGNADGTARLWDVDDPAHVQQAGAALSTNNGGLQSVAFAPDGRTLATGGLDGTTVLWSRPAKAAVRAPCSRADAGVQPGRTHACQQQHRRHGPVVGHGRPGSTRPAGPAAARLGRCLLHRLQPGRPAARGREREPHDPALGHLEPAPSHTARWSHRAHGECRGLAFSPRGGILATCGTDDAAQLWNVADPAHPTPSGPSLTGNTNYLNSIVFSPDGGALVTAGADGKIRLWDVHDPAHARPLGVPLAPGCWLAADGVQRRRTPACLGW